MTYLWTMYGSCELMLLMLLPEEAQLRFKIHVLWITVTITHSWIFFSKVARRAFTAGSVFVPVLLFKPKAKRDERASSQSKTVCDF